MPRKLSVVDETIQRERSTTWEDKMFRRLTGERERGTLPIVPKVQPAPAGGKRVDNRTSGTTAARPTNFGSKPKSKRAARPDPLARAKAEAFRAKRTRQLGSRFLFNATNPDEEFYWAACLLPVQGRINCAMGHNFGNIDGDLIASELSPELNETAPIVLGSCRGVSVGSVERLLGTSQVNRVANLTGQAVFAADHLVTPSEVAAIVRWLNENDVDAMGGVHPKVMGPITRDNAPPFSGWRWTFPAFSR
jgi:hypothetical protein